MVERWAFIYVQGAGADPSRDRVLVDGNGLSTTIVAVPEPAAALDVAVELVDDGVQLIELSGSFGPIWTARVIEAIEGRVPVGSVTYSAESVSVLTAIREAAA